MKRLAILVLLLCTACSMAEFFTGNNFNYAVAKINKIDAANNISFSDYSNGLEYLRMHPRYPDPLNINEIDPITKEYSKVVGAETTNLYASFRKNLLLSEKHYMLAYKTYKGDIEKYGIICSNNESILESFQNKNMSIEFGRNALQNINELKEKYPNEFSQLNISDEWLTNTKNFYIDLEGSLGHQKELYNYFCIIKQKNSTLKQQNSK